VLERGYKHKTTGVFVHFIFFTHLENKEPQEKEVNKGQLTSEIF